MSCPQCDRCLPPKTVCSHCGGNIIRIDHFAEDTAWSKSPEAQEARNKVSEYWQGLLNATSAKPVFLKEEKSMSDLIKAPSNALAVPDYLKDVKGNQGLENVNREDLVLPRLSICQSMTPQRKKGNPALIEGLEEGQLFNTITQEIYGDSVLVIPLVFSKSRIYFKALTEGGGILCQSFNGIDGGSLAPTCAECPNSKFGSNPDPKKQAPVCNIFMNFASLVLPSRQLIAASFKSTGLKAAKTWVTRLQMMNRPAYTQVYEIKTVAAKKNENDYFAPVINFKRWATEDEFKLAQDWYNSFQDKNIVIDNEDHGEEVSDEETPF